MKFFKSSEVKIQYKKFGEPEEWKEILFLSSFEVLTPRMIVLEKLHDDQGTLVGLLGDTAFYLMFIIEARVIENIVILESSGIRGTIAADGKGKDDDLYEIVRLKVLR